jgi:hypothetical protein
MAKQPSGIASAENLRDWANYTRSLILLNMGQLKLSPRKTFSRVALMGVRMTMCRLTNLPIGRSPRRTLRGRAGDTGPRLASATPTPARVGLREIKGKSPG